MFNFEIMSQKSHRNLAETPYLPLVVDHTIMTESPLGTPHPAPRDSAAIVTFYTNVGCFHKKILYGTVFSITK